MAWKPFIEVDADVLRRLYVEERKTTRQIAAVLGVGFKTITRRLHQFGIQPRQQGPERHEQLRDPEWLRAQYLDQNKATTQIAREIGASTRVVLTWLREHGIETRPRNQHTGKHWSEEVRRRMSIAKKGKLTGPAHPLWKGGPDKETQRQRTTYEAKQWSIAVRERDGHKCIECGATGRLHAHHIKPWKHHPELRLDVSNGATLCPKCHQKAHGWFFPSWAYHGETRTSAKQSQD